MLLTREEMTFDFDGAKLDPVRDRAALAWTFNQFLYGEVTGIQVGHWLYNAPSLQAARFLAKQALEEFQHVDNFVRMLALIGEEPAEPHKMVRFMSTGMMPGTWAEHVALEMALGEGLVLHCMYALIDTIDHDEISSTLERASKQEARHVAFGESETMRLVANKASVRRRLLGLSLLSLWGAKRIATALAKRVDPAHPVLSQLPAFSEHVVQTSALRLERMGVLERPFDDYGAGRRAALIAQAQIGQAFGGFASLFTTKERLTSTYLRDPSLKETLRKAQERAQ